MKIAPEKLAYSVDCVCVSPGGDYVAGSGNHENVTWARSTSMAHTWTWTRPSTGMPIMQLSVPRHQAFHANDTDTCIPNYKGI